MTPQAVWFAFSFNPFFLLALAIAYWAIFQPDSTKLKVRVLTSICLLLMLSLSSSAVLMAAEIPEPCRNVDPNSWWWWFFGCGL
jgi:hypothetical protein